MSALEDRPTLGERYGGAMESANLRVAPGRCDADMLIAAGWLPDSLGAALFRLAHEFDAVKGEIGIGQAEFDRTEQAARVFDAEALAAQRWGNVWGAWAAREEAKDIRERAESAARLAHSLILMRLKTRREVRDALVEFARPHAEDRGLGLSELVLKGLVIQALDIHLDRTCHQCQGRGFNGGFGAPRIPCRPCRETGKRDGNNIGRDQRAREFGEWLLQVMSRAMGVAGAGIGRVLRGDDETTAAERAAAQAEITRTLGQLRTADAAAD